MTKGIMFDMDNTILYSNINFKEMQDKVIGYLNQKQKLPLELFVGLSTPAEVIEVGKRELIRKLYPQTDVRAKIDWGKDVQLAEINTAIWDLVKEVETEGMIGAQLAPDAKETLHWLKQRDYTLAIVTNNAYESARLALEETEILQVFDLLVSRDQMEGLKPAPSGLLYAKENLRTVHSWLMVGDSWIDGKAAALAAIPFIAYQAELADMQKNDVPVLAYLESFEGLKEWIKTHY